jgi:hypothetical protein
MLALLPSTSLERSGLTMLLPEFPKASGTPPCSRGEIRIEMDTLGLHRTGRTKPFGAMY